MSDKAGLLQAIEGGIRAYCDAHHDFSFHPEAPVVRLHEPTNGADEIFAAVQVLLDTFVTQGPKVKAFEQHYANAYGCRHGVMNNSGSSANLLAVAALANPATPDGLRAGDEVIVPALSWSTTVWPIIQCGLVPVVVDIDPVTLNIDPEQIERAIGPRTRAVMPVHVYGNPCDMDALVELCRRRDLILIEDSCESMGAFYDGKAVGSFGRVGTFSLYYSHHISTLEGGICVTSDAELADLMRILRSHGWIREVENRQPYLDANPDIDPKFLFVNVGYNLRATEMQAAIGLAQLPKLPGFVDRRRATAAFWQKELAQYGDVLAMQGETPKARSSWFGIPVTLKPGAPFGVADLRRHFSARGIENRPIIAGNIAAQPAMKYYAHRVVGDLPHAGHVMKAAFSFGNHQAIDDGALAHVAEAFRSFMATI
ncbi:DegT/DnrJ/EryC1/StrS aminotransferase family protein [Magnetospirillum sp. UT-4]|uniref:DegT/DnrJ/EryC1/StrS family aminotransferase n=1 Tax=Magnetospirillum sp. UT-4 TaxID=2681467 RepID=UPI00137EA5B5|nr:DegT/DnrJ/EryC1/StrS family aminotransferase [Magnetospirillum sp. UT-4]CAA7618415.1 conserved hypothetical protein [Magnetospirillum sp. UT-4]